MLYPILVLTVIVAGTATIILRVCITMMTPGNGNHTVGVPVGNPFRIGSTVLICEDVTRPEMNFYGTVLSTNRGMLTVRDTSAPYASVELDKSYVYPANSNLGW